jgi:hypothetical protein
MKMVGKQQRLGSVYIQTEKIFQTQNKIEKRKTGVGKDKFCDT